GTGHRSKQHRDDRANSTGRKHHSVVDRLQVLVGQAEENEAVDVLPPQFESGIYGVLQCVEELIHVCVSSCPLLLHVDVHGLKGQIQFLKASPPHETYHLFVQEANFDALGSVKLDAFKFWVVSDELDKLREV